MLCVHIVLYFNTLLIYSLWLSTYTIWIVHSKNRELRKKEGIMHMQARLLKILLLFFILLVLVL